MINKEIFETIKKYSKNNREDTIYALMEEVGEYAKAARVEQGLAPHKTITESAKIETIDVLLVAIEAYIVEGGTIEEMSSIVASKMHKWINIREKDLDLHKNQRQDCDQHS